jgi:hypothetical protein
MAIFARDLDCGAWFVVQIAVAVRVLVEVAIDAVHAALEMYVGEVHGLAELRRVVRRDDAVLRIEQVAFAVAFVNFAKHPTVAVEIRKLRVAQERIERRRPRVFQKIKIGPETA